MSEFKKIKCQDGGTFTVAGIEFIKFPSVNGETPVLMKDIAFRSRFGKENNDLRASIVLKQMQKEILPKIIEALGEENVCTFETDLTTLDGLKTYGVMESKISLRTLDFHRANAKILGKYRLDGFEWLATPESAQPNDDPDYVLCVAPSGSIRYCLFYSCGFGARPFLIFKSTIFEYFEG